MKLHISRDIFLPIESVTQTFAILAKRRVGKTYTASVIAEEFVKTNLPFVVLDPTGAWWGLRSGKDGKAEDGMPVYVIGGEHGIPLEPTAGKVIAEQVATNPSFYVIDVSQFDSNAAQDRFATDFAERLYRIKEKHREPMHLFIDEADAFVPQRPMPGQQRMLGAFEALVRRGGIRGIGVTLISQRPAVVNKNVLTQSECLIVLQTTSPQDQDAIDDWIKRNGTDEARKTLMSSLASLQKSEAWIYSPAWLEVFKKVNIRERETFNSSATPKAGEKIISNPILKPVDLNKLSEQIKATIEKVKENDPAILKKKISDLERQIKTPAKATIDNALTEKLRIENKRLSDELLQAKMFLKNRNELLSKTGADIAKAVKILSQYSESSMNANVEIPVIKLYPEIPKGSTIVTKYVENKNTDDIKLRAGARRLLAALVQWSPQGMTESQMRSHAGLKNSGTYSAYKTDLRTSGFMEEKGGLLFATEKGIEHLGHEIPSPSTTEEVLAIWLPKLRLGARRMIEILVKNGGEPMTNEELREKAELSNSGTYSSYKTDLRTAQLITVDRGLIAANKEILFL